MLFSMQCVNRWLVVAAICLSVVVGFCQSFPDAIAKSRALLEAGKAEQAENLLRSLLASQPESAEAHFLLGYALFREQKARESLAEFTAGARYRRPGADELKVVAGDYVLLKDYSAADRWFSQVVAESPSDAEAWYLLGRTKFNEGEFRPAISEFEHALSLSPRYVEAENNIGLCLKELNEFQKAREAFETAILWEGEAASDAQPFLNIGWLLSDQRQYTDAVPFLVKAAAIAPENPAVHEALGKTYLGLDKLAEAQSELEKAIAESPDISSLHFKLAQVLRREGLTDRAKQEFEICEKLNGAHSSPITPNPP
jgi:tetratricopeptide (TPR) repeat protein